MGGLLFGAGYNPRGSLSVGEFEQMSAEALTTRIGGFMTDNPAALLGIPFGLVGVGVGMTADMIMGAFTGQARERNALATSLQAFADPLFGGMTRDQSREMAGDLQARTRSFKGYLDDFNLQDVQEVMATFGQAGGYTGITNPQDFQQRTREVLDNVRAMAHSLGVFQEEAAQIMGELQQRGVVATGSMGSFGAFQQAAGATIGMSGLQFMQSGLQGAQMVQGAGIGAATGFGMMQESLLSVGAIQRTPQGAALIQDMGGRSAAAAASMELVINQAQSSRGLIRGANLLSGGDFFENDPTRQLLGAAEWFGGDPTNYLTLLAGQGQLTAATAETYGIQGMSLGIIGTAVEKMQQLGLTNAAGKVESLALIGFINQTEPYTINEAKLMMQNAFVDMRSINANAFTAGVNQILQESSSTILQRGIASVKAGGAATWDLITGGPGST